MSSYGWDCGPIALGLEEFDVQHSHASEARGRQQWLHSAETAWGFMHKTFEGYGPGTRMCLGVGECTRDGGSTTRPHLLNMFL